MFSYILSFELKGKGRPADITIRTEVDYNLTDRGEELTLLKVHNCIPRLEKMFGKGVVQEVKVTGKTRNAERV